MCVRLAWLDLPILKSRHTHSSYGVKCLLIKIGANSLLLLVMKRYDFSNLFMTIQNSRLLNSGLRYLVANIVIVDRRYERVEMVASPAAVPRWCPRHSRRPRRSDQVPHTLGFLRTRRRFSTSTIPYLFRPTTRSTPSLPSTRSSVRQGPLSSEETLEDREICIRE